MSPDPTRPDDDLAAICQTVDRLPFAGLVAVPAPVSTDRIGDVLADLAAWLAEYRAVVHHQSDDFTRQAAQLRRLEDERATVRAFFGLAGEDDQ